VRVHCSFNSFSDPDIDRILQRRHQRKNIFALIFRKGSENEIREILVNTATLLARPHPNPKASVLLVSDRLLHALESVVPAGRARSPKTESPERQCDFVYQDQQMLRGIEARKRAKRGHGGPASIHVGERLEQLDRRSVDRARGLPCAFAPAKRTEAPALGQAVGQPEAGIVPGVRVLRAGIPQPHDSVQALLFGLAFALAFGLRLPNELGLGRSFLDHFGRRRRLLGARGYHGADR